MVSATVWASAPGKKADTLIVGGAYKEVRNTPASNNVPINTLPIAHKPQTNPKDNKNGNQSNILYNYVKDIYHKYVFVLFDSVNNHYVFLYHLLYHHHKE